MPPYQVDIQAVEGEERVLEGGGGMGHLATCTVLIRLAVFQNSRTSKALIVGPASQSTVSTVHALLQ